MNVNRLWLYKSDARFLQACGIQTSERSISITPTPMVKFRTPDDTWYSVPIDKFEEALEQFPDLEIIDEF